MRTSQKRFFLYSVHPSRVSKRASEKRSFFRFIVNAVRRPSSLFDATRLTKSGALYTAGQETIMYRTLQRSGMRAIFVPAERPSRNIWNSPSSDQQTWKLQPSNGRLQYLFGKRINVHCVRFACLFGSLKSNQESINQSLPEPLALPQSEHFQVGYDARD